MSCPLRRLPRNIWTLSATSFLRDVSSEMLIHLMPLFLANVLGARTAVIGLIEGIAETTSSLVKVYSGWLSDRMGRRKGLTVAGYGIAALATPLLLIARSWPIVLLYRFLDRVGKGVRTAPRDALLAGSTPQDQRGIAFGLHRAADSAGALVGLLLAMGIVYTLQSGATTLDGHTFRVVVTWALVPAVLAVVVVALGVKETAKKPPKGSAPRLSLRGFDQPFRRFLVVIVLFTLGNSTDAFLVLRAQGAGSSVAEVLGMLALFNLVYTCLSTSAGSLSDRIDRRRVILAGWVLYALVYCGFALSTQAWHFWVLYAFYGAYYALTEGVMKAFVADLVPEEKRRGTAYGVYHSAVGLTVLPASVLAGLLWQGLGTWSGLGPAAPFLVGSGLALMAAGLLWWWVPRSGDGGTNPDFRDGSGSEVEAHGDDHQEKKLDEGSDLQ